MDEDNFSGITEVTKTIYISLPPEYMSKKIDGVKDILESWKCQYVQQLHGVVVSYKNVSVSSKGGFIDTDNPFINYEVKATFELFCPTIGSIVKGKINRVSHEHIGCLVHNIINATIKRSKKASDRVNQFISLDCMILFQITFYDFHRKVIRLRGEITEECVKLMKELPLFNTQSIVFESNESTSASSLESEASMSIDEGSRNEEMEEESPSLLTSDYSSLKNPNFVSIFNADNPVDETSLDGPVFETPSSSHESDSSSSNHTTFNHILHNQTDQESVEDSVDENPAVQNTFDGFRKSNSIPSPSKKKRKHKDKLSKDKSSKKKSPKRAFTDFENQHIKSPSKKKKLKKKNMSTNVKDVKSPKKHKKKSSKKLLKEIKQESPVPLYESNSSEEKDISNFLDDEMMHLFSQYEPSPEDQLLAVKEEPVEISKKSQKRKRESSDKEGLPRKRNKVESDKISSSKGNGKSEKKAKSKKKGKEKSKKHSKKDKQKSKGKHLNLKNKQSGEVKLKKKKKSDKSRTKKRRK